MGGCARGNRPDARERLRVVGCGGVARLARPPHAAAAQRSARRRGAAPLTTASALRACVLAAASRP
eukprot:15160511-Alexandrium_andersonii.AAC.1